MRQIHVKADAVLDAHPEDVYAAIADYKHGHPNIIPKESFPDLQVEQSGYGAGTIINFKFKALGVVKSFHQRVTEPEPGRVLVEQDIDTPQNATTTFTVTPVDDGQKAHVEIATTMNRTPGLTGLVEQVAVPMINVRVYRKELKLLEAFAQRGSVRVG
ncbi:MAG TPA: SRPBCC family protein [Ktedonobacteraceae bacterium]|nr:SRPBCC family protein [Ktedonobacteraceae bacterium]